MRGSTAMLLRVLLSLTLLSAAALPLAAQNAALLVRVNGAEGPLAGALVEVRGGETVAARTTADSAGLARLVGLVPGTYSVRVEAIGYAPRLFDGITLAAGQARVLGVLLQALPYELDPIEVRADRVQIQRENTDFSTTVDEVAIEMLPLMNDAAALVALTPGARADHVWGGASFQANSYRLDGLPANHPGLGGSIVEPSINWIDRIEVRGLGAGAEHGGFQGGQVHIVTKSGTNDFSAMVRSQMSHHALSASNLVATETASEVQRRNDAEGEVRGALVRDRLFYYLAGAYANESARYLNHLASVETRYAPILERRIERKLFGKLSWAPRAADELELSGGFLGTTADNYGMTGYEGTGAAAKYSSPTWFGNLSWRHLMGDWGTLEARVNRFARDEREEPYDGPATPGIRLFSLIPPYTSFRNAAFRLRSAPASTSGRLVSTFRIATGEQEHTITVGGEYSHGSFLDQRSRNGGMTWMPIRSGLFDPEDPATWSGEVEGYTPTAWGGEVSLDADVVNAAAFVQTSISLGRLVLSPGLRWGLWQGWSNPREGSRFKAIEDRAIDPRIGAMLELTEDGSFVVKGHWGRYHQNMIAQMFDRATGSDVFTDREIWHYTGPPVDPARAFTEAERDALAAQGLFTRQSVVTLNETGPVVDYDQPYIDQWLVGVEKQFGSSVKLEALYTHRSNRDMIALVDRNRSTNYTNYGRTTVHMAGPSGPALPFEGWYVALEELYVPNNVILERLRYCAVNPDICGPPPNLSFADTLTLAWDPDYVLTNAPGATREFGQLQLTVEVARPRWGASFSVAVTGLEGNLDNVSGYVDPAEFGPGPYVRVNEAVNGFGALPNFAEREAKVSVWGSLPWDLRGGLFWTYRSGDHYGARFRITADRNYYGYRVNGYAARAECYRLGELCTPGQWGDALPNSFLAPLEGHHVFVGPRGGSQMKRLSLLDARLERRFDFHSFDLGATLAVFNLFGMDEVTEIQQLVNHGQNFNYFNKDISDPELWTFPPNLYYRAPLERAPPRRLHVEMSVYF